MVRGLTFDDVLLVPQKSDVLPKDVNVHTQLTKKIQLNIPILTAAMDTVTEHETAIAIARLGGLGVIHKNMTAQAQAEMIVKVKNAPLLSEPFTESCVDSEGKLRVGAAIGPNDFDRVNALVTAGVDVLVLDTAHGHSENVLNAVQKIKKEFTIELIAGNISTGKAALDLMNAGADAIKCGQGPGSICTTRIVTGCGMPQLTAIMECAKAMQGKIPLIADGGIRYSGDITKALAAGASCVMLGSLFAGCDETPGTIVDFGGQKFKQYRGMGSLQAMVKGSKERYQQGHVQSVDKLVPEGIAGIVPYKGSLASVCHQLIGGLRAGMGMTGSHTIKELQSNAEFVELTPAGLMESHPHTIKITEKAPNYD